ncbi:MAG: hypothetical protein WDL87_05410 [Candidatus Omnitrophota bacterium]|jgi:hypothetical protein
MKKTLGIMLIVLCALGVATLAFADITLSVNAVADSGSSFGDHAVLKCKGYSYVATGNPWTQCTNLGSVTTMNFGTLTHSLKDTAGVETGDAGCFYAEDFFIIYMFPDCWGGKGYDLQQTTQTFPSAIDDAVVRTAVYAKEDKYSTTGPEQGALTAAEITLNPQLGVTYLAKDITTGHNRILKAKRARIVRAEYGIPPFAKTGETRPTGWTAIDKGTLAGTYSGSVRITLTEWQ